MSSASPVVVPPPPDRPFEITKKRTRLFGLTLDEAIKAFFGGNALVAVIVLALITIFLFREGADFFPQNRHNIEVYRRAGLEYVDFIRAQEQDHTALTRYLSDVRLRALQHLTKEENLPVAEAQARLAAFDDWAGRYSDAVEPIRGLISELGDVAVAIKTKYTVAEDRKEERAQLLAVGRTEDAAAVQVDTIDFKAELAPLVGTLPVYREASAAFGQALLELLPQMPELSTDELRGRMERFRQLTRDYVDTFPGVAEKMEKWDYAAPVPWWKALTSFLFGREWLTASFWQDWYGILPLFTGSLLVSVVALSFAVPFGIGAAIYTNQIAGVREQRFIKPCIEFISAFPSVVLGFFGIAVLGSALRALSGVSWLSWVPGFPFSERLNAFTAGCLLALIAVPTIFTLAEDALNNVPRGFREASFALGASRLQTTFRIIIPAALSGMISAVLLGFGRVIGETMVVLLCAGNRIAIPDFTQGIGVFTQPVHTMTGIIAQEMGEVGPGSIHWRALFVVGIVLFFLALLVNYVAVGVVRRYKISIG